MPQWQKQLTQHGSIGSAVWMIIDRSTTAEPYLYDRVMHLNAKGEAWRSGISLSGSTTLTASDPVTETTTSAETTENENWHVSTMKTYNDANAAVVLRTTKTSADGRTTKQIEFGRTTTTTRTYYNTADEKGMSVMTTTPDGTTVTDSYTSEGLLESSPHSVSGETTYTYDGLNRVATQSHVENGEEHVISYTYDKRNQLLSTTESCGDSSRTTSFEYDIMGRKVKEIRPGNRVVTYTYDLTGALTAMSGAETYPQSYTYEFGRMKTLTTYRDNPDQPDTTTWNYDLLGRLVSKKYADNTQVSYAYNGNGQLQTRTWANGRTTSYSYDGAGRLLSISYGSDDTPTITYSYNRLGQMTQVVDAAGTRTITYNADNTPATETVPNVTGHTVTHTYDTLGRETALKLMNGATALYNVGYTYDNMSRLATATFANQSATYSRVSGSNRLNTTVFKNGTTAIHTATRSYDNFNRLLGVNGYTYTYNDKDERTKQTLADGNYWNYEYDTSGQVTSGIKKTSAGAQVSGQNYAYTYDTIGNRKTATANSAVTNYTANEVNQYTAIGSVSPTYDTDGNMLTGYNGWTMEWNGENRLKTIYNATTKLEFAYDYMGRRFSKKVYTKSGTSWVLSSEKAFAYNGYKQIAEFTVNGTTPTLSKSTVWQPASSGDLDVVLWYRDGSTVYTLLPDGNKNTRQLKNTAGTVAATYDYDPFGNVIATTGTVANPWKFSSEYHDSETGLVYYNYRDYAPSLGRWISRDPIGENGGMNVLVFIENNSICFLDKFGLKWQIYRNNSMTWGVAHYKGNTQQKHISSLAEKMLLNANEAFGPKGWIKTLDLTNILNNQQFRKEDCIAVPNTIAIIKGEKSILNKQDDFDAITRRVISLVNNNNFKVAKHLDEKGILGVIYIGHFTAKGHFLMLGKGNVDYRSIYPNAISYHIAAFIGLGCTSSRHDWYKATARGLVWSTNYKINLNNLANVPLTEIYPDGAIFPEDGNYVPPARLLDYYTGSTGKKGISLQKFIETFAHHIAGR